MKPAAPPDRLALQAEAVECAVWFDLEDVRRRCAARDPALCVPRDGLNTLCNYLKLPALPSQEDGSGH